MRCRVREHEELHRHLDVGDAVGVVNHVALILNPRWEMMPDA